MRQSSSRLVDVLREHGVPCEIASQRGLSEQLDSGVWDDKLLKYDHPRWGRVRTIAPPLRLSLTPCVFHGAAPAVGQDTEDILLAAAYGADEIHDLAKRGTICQLHRQIRSTMLDATRLS